MQFANHQAVFLKSHLGSSRSTFCIMAALDPITLVVEGWKSNVTLCKQASTGVMAIVGKNQEINRREVVANAAVIEPIVVHMGILVGYLINILKLAQNICFDLYSAL